MALTLPANFANDLGKDTNLVPVVVIGNSAIDTENIILSIGTWSMPDGSWRAKPLLLNIPSLKESIDIEKRNYKISNVTLDISNYEYNGTRFSELIGNNSLINTECRIFWASPSAYVPVFYDQPGAADSANRMVQIYFGTIRRYTHDSEKVKLVIEDRSQANLHKDLPVENVGTEGVPDRYKNKPIPMVYGNVDRSPCLINNAPLVGDDELISGEISIIADSSTAVGFNSSNPLYTSKEEAYINLLKEHDEVDFTPLVDPPEAGKEDVRLKYAPSNQYNFANNQILLTPGYGGNASTETGGNAISINHIIGFESLKPNSIVPLRAEASFSDGWEYRYATTHADFSEGTYSPTYGRIMGTLFRESTADQWGNFNDGNSLIPPGNDIGDWVNSDDSHQASLVGCKISIPVVGESAYVINTGLVYVHFRAGFFNKTHMGDGANDLGCSFRVRFGGDKYKDHAFFDPKYTNEQLVGEGPYWITAGMQLNPLADESNYGDFSTHNSFDGDDLPLKVDRVESLLYYMRCTSDDFIMIGITDFVDMKVEHFMLIDSILNLDYYADVKGRFPQDDLNNGVWVIGHIVEHELGVAGASMQGAAPYEDWKYSFTIDKKINSKKLIEGIASASPYIPRFDHMGNFKFDTIKKSYKWNDVAQHRIIADDVINSSFSRTPIEDVGTVVKLDYKWNYARKAFDENVFTLALPGWYDRGYYGFPKNSADNYDPEDGYDPDAESTLVIDDDRGKYIRLPGTAEKFANWMLYFYCNQHLKIKVRMPLKYMSIEIGDTVRFDKIIDVKPYGINYAEDAMFDDPNSNYNFYGDLVNGQQVYPDFMVISTNKTLEWVEIECMQMHNLTGDGYEPAAIYGCMTDGAWNYNADATYPSACLIPPNNANGTIGSAAFNNAFLESACHHLVHIFGLDETLHENYPEPDELPEGVDWGDDLINTAYHRYDYNNDSHVAAAGDWYKEGFNVATGTSTNIPKFYSHALIGTKGCDQSTEEVSAKITSMEISHFNILYGAGPDFTTNQYGDWNYEPTTPPVTPALAFVSGSNVTGLQPYVPNYISHSSNQYNDFYYIPFPLWTLDDQSVEQPQSMINMALNTNYVNGFKGDLYGDLKLVVEGVSMTDNPIYPATFIKFQVRSYAHVYDSLATNSSTGPISDLEIEHLNPEDAVFTSVDNIPNAFEIRIRNLGIKHKPPASYDTGYQEYSRIWEIYLDITIKNAEYVESIVPVHIRFGVGDASGLPIYTNWLLEPPGF